jgi:squalene synthase HpnC
MFVDDLKQFGPEGQYQTLSIAQSQRYCRQLAHRHYENFTVASRLLPRKLHQHLCNVYAYCRWADDLADEIGDAQRSIALLDWWEAELQACYEGRKAHPVFIALAETIRQFAIPIDPFRDLLRAFRQDQQITRYETSEQVLGYCRYSANPVGRLVLYLGECCTSDRVRLSDSICTGLQLANFCQDVARDWQNGRIYLPLTICRQHGYDEAAFARQEFNASFRQIMTEQVAQADAMLRDGLPLVSLMPSSLQLAVALFIHGGLATLEAIRRQDYDIWRHRPALSKLAKLRLLVGCWWNLRRGR